MRLNLDLVAAELSAWRPRCFFPHSVALPYDRIETLDSASRPRNGSLFLVDERTYRELPSLWENAGCGFVVIGPLERQRAGMPALALERPSSLASVQGKLLSLHARLNAWTDHIMDAIASGAPLQDVFDIVAQEFRNPLMLSDEAFLFVLTAGHVPEDFHDRFWTPAMETGVCPVERYSDTWRRVGADIHLRRQACLVEDRETGRHYIYRYLASDESLYGMFELADVNAPFSNADIALVEHVASLLELAVRQSAFRKYSEQANDPLYRLLEGHPVDDYALHALLERRGWSAADPFYTCYVVNSVDMPDLELSAQLSMTANTALLYPLEEESPDTAVTDPSYELGRHVERQIANRLPYSCLFSTEDGCILVVREEDHALSDLRDRMEQKRFDENDPIELLIGISSLHTGFRELAIARDQAKRALRWAKTAQGGMLGSARACFYDDAFCLDLADRLDVQENVKWLVPESVARLAAYDKAENAGYQETLIAYLEHGCNMNRTADALFIHRNTLAYRIKRIRAISGINLENLSPGDGLLRIWLACRILRDLPQ